MKRIAAAGTVLAFAVSTALIGVGTAQAAVTGTVYVGHGIPDLPVDVYVDGTLAIDDFEPATVQGPLELPAGAHTVADATDNSKPVLTAEAT